MGILSIAMLAIAAVAAVIPGAIMGLLVGIIFNRRVESDTITGGVVGSFWGAAAYFVASYFFNKEFYPGVMISMGTTGLNLPLDLLIYAVTGSLLAALLCR